MQEAQKVINVVIDKCLAAGDDGLARFYVGKRGRELVMVKREHMTVTERGRHVSRLRRLGQTSEAEALEAETLNLIFSNQLKLTKKEDQREALSDDVIKRLTATPA